MQIPKARRPSCRTITSKLISHNDLIMPRHMSIPCVISELNSKPIRQWQSNSVYILTGFRQGVCTCTEFGQRYSDRTRAGSCKSATSAVDSVAKILYSIHIHPTKIQTSKPSSRIVSASPLSTVECIKHSQGTSLAGLQMGPWTTLQA